MMSPGSRTMNWLMYQTMWSTGEVLMSAVLATVLPGNALTDRAQRERLRVAESSGDTRTGPSGLKVSQLFPLSH